MKKNDTDNYLEKIPCHTSRITWTKNDEDIVTLERENKGVINRIAQLLFRRPKVSYIHLDEHGSFVWCNIDGERSILDIASLVDARFAERAHPLYERLAKYFQILESYGFIFFK